MGPDSLHREIRHLLTYARALLKENNDDAKILKLKNYVQLLLEHEQMCRTKISLSQLNQIKEVLPIIQQDLWIIEAS